MMDCDGSFEDFQETRQIASARKAKLIQRLLKRKRGNETAKSLCCSTKRVKKNSSQSSSQSKTENSVIKVNDKITLNHVANNVCSSATPSAASSNEALDIKKSCDNGANNNCNSESKQEIKNISKITCDNKINEIPSISTSKESLQENEKQPPPKNENQIPLEDQNSDQPIDETSDDDMQMLSTSIVDPMWQCMMCKESVPMLWRDSHFAHCLKKYEHKKGHRPTTSTTESIVCDVCKLDITPFSTYGRSEHVNRCLDLQNENDASLPQAADNISTNEPCTTIIKECPLCNKTCRSVEAKLAHVKKCSQHLGINVQCVISALQLQKKHVEERILLGLPLPSPQPPVHRTRELHTRKPVKEPKSKAVADIELAKALSLSIEEDEKRKDQLELSICEEIEFVSSSTNSVERVQLQPPKNVQNPGNRKKKQVPVKKPVPILLLRTDEERLKLLEERVSAIIMPSSPLKNESSSDALKESPSSNNIEKSSPGASEKPVSCDTSSISSPNDMDNSSIPEFKETSKLNTQKSCHLWNLTGKANDKMTYYTSELLEFVTPSDVETGSKLKSLSQLPGHRIYTQKPYDFSFSCTPKSEEGNNSLNITKSPVKIPSTQEMLDIIIDDHEPTMDKVQPDCSMNNIDPSIIQPPNITNYTPADSQNSDGFLRMKDESGRSNIHPVISCLETLVNNVWMSDVDIAVSDGAMIPAHKFLLMLRCPGLREKFINSIQSEKLLLDWSDISSNICTHFLNYVYTGSMSWKISDSADILRLAKRCQMKEFDWLQRELDPENCLANILSEESILSNHETSCSQQLEKQSVEMMNKSEKLREKNNLTDLICNCITDTSTPDISPTCEKHSNFTDSKEANSSGNCERDIDVSNTSISKYFNISKDESEAKENADVCNNNLTQLLSESLQSEEHSKSPELFICDSDDDDDIPPNQELNSRKSLPDQIINETVIDETFSISARKSCMYIDNPDTFSERVTSPVNMTTSRTLQSNFCPSEISACCSVPHLINKIPSDPINVSSNQTTNLWEKSTLKFSSVENISALNDPNHTSHIFHKTYSSEANNEKTKSVHSDSDEIIDVNDDISDQPSSTKYFSPSKSCSLPSSTYPTSLRVNLSPAKTYDSCPVNSTNKGNLWPKITSEDFIDKKNDGIWNNSKESGATLKNTLTGSNKLKTSQPELIEVIDLSDNEDEKCSNEERISQSCSSNASIWDKTTLKFSTIDKSVTFSQCASESLLRQEQVLHPRGSPDRTILYDACCTNARKIHETNSYQSPEKTWPSPCDTNNPFFANSPWKRIPQKLSPVAKISVFNNSPCPATYDCCFQTNTSSDLNLLNNSLHSNLYTTNSCIENCPPTVRKLDSIPSQCCVRETCEPLILPAYSLNSEHFNPDFINSSCKFTRLHSQPEMHCTSPVSCERNYNSLTKFNPCVNDCNENQRDNRSSAARRNLWNENFNMTAQPSSSSKHSDTITKNMCPSPIILSSDDDEHNPVLSPKIVDSDSEKELAEYYNNSRRSEEKLSVERSPNKRYSFSQPCINNYINDDEILPLHLRVQRILNKGKEKEVVVSPPSSPLCVVDDDDSQELRSTSQKEKVCNNNDENFASNKENNIIQNGVVTPVPDKRVKSLQTSECFMTDSPITPLPNFDEMMSPEIKVALKKYGIRALPRKKAVSLLSHIYNETHPFVDSSGNTIKESSNHLHISKKSKPKKHKKVGSQELEEQLIEPDSSSQVESSSTICQSKPLETVVDDDDATTIYFQQNTNNLSNSQSSSDKSDLSDVPEESFCDMDDISPSQVENSLDTRTKLLNYITTNVQLYTKMLMYEPLNFSTFHQELRENGIKINATNLMNFLDEECITFTLPRSEKAKQKQQKRTQRFRKRMIEKLSQQNSQNIT